MYTHTIFHSFNDLKVEKFKKMETTIEQSTIYGCRVPYNKNFGQQILPKMPI